MTEHQPTKGDANRPAPCHLQLISDEPASESSFPAHKQLAATIVDLILEQKGGRAIALEGGWGTGKSTIVQLLKIGLKQGGEKAKKAPERHSTGRGYARCGDVFVFDAWAHESDPLRRAFLEKLTRHLTHDKDEKTIKKWEEELASRVTGRKIETVVSETPTLRSGLSLVMIFLALAFVFFAPILSSLLTGHGIDWSNGLHVWAVLFTAMPAVLLIVGVVVLAFKVKGARETIAKFLSMWEKKVDTEVSTTTHETLGPTTIEFECFFTDLMQDLAIDDARRLVIVLDNLDRLPEDTAHTLWSTLRLFLDACERPENEWARRVWFLVPYDRDAARRLWERDESVPDPSGNKVIPPRLSSAFLDKTLQVRFEVPPLPMTDWKGYLTTLLEGRFPEFDGDEETFEEEVHRIYLLSRSLSDSKGRPPTPRHLKLYVNDIVAMRRRYGESFAVHQLAMYALLRRDGHDVRSLLLQDHDQLRQIERVLGHVGYRPTLAALAFGVTDITQAQELLLRPLIGQAMLSGDGGRLTGLAKVYGFWEVLEQCMADATFLVDHDSVAVGNMVNAVGSSEWILSGRREIRAVRLFLDQKVRNAVWGSVTEATGAVAANAVLCRLNEQSLQALLGKPTDAKRAQDGGEFNAEAWIKAVTQVAAACADSRVGGAVRRVAYLPIQDAGLKTVLPPLYALKEPVRRCAAQLIVFDGDLNSAASEFYPRAEQAWAERSEQIMRMLLIGESKGPDWKKILSLCAARLSYADPLDPDEIRLLVEFMNDAQPLHGSAVSSAVASLRKNGVLFKLINDSMVSLAKPFTVVLMRWILESPPLNVPGSATSPAKAGFDVFLGFANDPKRHRVLIDALAPLGTGNDIPFPLMRLMEHGASIGPLIRGCIARLHEQNRLGEYLRAEDFVSQYAEFEKSYHGAQDALLQLANDLLTYERFVNELHRVEIDHRSLAGHVRLVEHGATLKSSAYADQIANFLHGINQETWHRAIEQGDQHIYLLRAYCTSHPETSMGVPLAQAIEGVLTKLISQDSTRTISEELWAAMFSAISASTRSDIAKRLVAQASRVPDGLHRILPIFGDELKTAAQKHENGNFLHNAMTPLLKTGSVDALHWMADVLGSKPPFWNEADRKSCTAFSESLAGLARSAPQGHREAIQRIADALKVSIEFPKVPDKEDSEPE